MKRVTIKIGSNVLSRPDGTLDVTRVSHLVDQIAALRRAGLEVIVVSSGAVACGRSELAGSVDASRLDQVSRRQLFSAVGQVKLINRYFDLFRDHGIAIGQVLTLKESFATRRHYLNQRACLMVMLNAGVIPVVNENDTVSVTELMFTDNDELSAMVATMTDCDALVILSNIDGIYTGNPADPTSQLIERVDTDADLTQYISTERSGFGRGGMVTKYRVARLVANEGIEVIIANGKSDNILMRLLIDGTARCTRFAPADQPTNSLKRWIAHSEGFAKGVIHLDQQAAIAIMGETAASVLPIGVTAIDGDFDRDELVTVVAPDGTRLGVGQVTLNANDARKIIGRHGHKPLIHYDYLYIAND